MNKISLDRYLAQKYPDECIREKSIEGWFVKYLKGFDGYNIETALEHIMSNGCSFGFISELIYTPDVLRFYARYETQVWDTISEHLETTGQTFGQFWDSMKIDITDPNLLKVHLTWFALESLTAEILRYHKTNDTNPHHAALRAEGGEILPKSKEENQCKQIA